MHDKMKDAQHQIYAGEAKAAIRLPDGCPVCGVKKREICSFRMKNWMVRMIT